MRRPKFNPGDEIVCINAADWHPGSKIEKGNIYTVVCMQGSECVSVKGITFSYYSSRFALHRTAAERDWMLDETDYYRAISGETP